MLKPLPSNKTINVLRCEYRVRVIIVVVDADRMVTLQWLQISTECLEYEHLSQADLLLNSEMIRGQDECRSRWCLNCGLLYIFCTIKEKQTASNSNRIN